MEVLLVHIGKAKEVSNQFNLQSAKEINQRDIKLWKCLPVMKLDHARTFSARVTGHSWNYVDEKCAVVHGVMEAQASSQVRMCNYYWLLSKPDCNDLCSAVFDFEMKGPTAVKGPAADLELHSYATELGKACPCTTHHGIDSAEHVNK